MKEFPLLLVGIGAFLIILGIAWHVGSRYFPLGRLPGDIAVEGGNFKFYFPLVTSIIISILLTLIVWVILWIRK